MAIDAEAMIGHTLAGVSSSWHEFEGRRSAGPVHVWLRLDGVGALRLHTLNGLVITPDDVDVPCAMGDYGRMLVESSGPTPLIERLGEPIEAVTRLDQSPPGMTVGVVLQFAGGSVGIADLGDELVVAPWPADDWSRWNVSVQPVG
ncbi:hypothetical protein [Intrasporangium mesophilum]